MATIGLLLIGGFIGLMIGIRVGEWIQESKCESHENQYHHDSNR